MLLTQPELITLERFNKNPNAFSNDKIEEAFRIFDEIIEGLDEYGIRELMGGSEADLDKLWNVIFESIISTLYGNDNTLGEKLSYFDHVSEQIEEVLSIENLNYFILSKMPNFQMNWHHLEWGDVVQRYDRFAMIAARDHGKSYFFSNAYLVWKMYRYSPYIDKSSRKDLSLSKRGFLFSFSQQQAVDLLEILKNTIEDYDSIRERLLPKSRNEGWGKTDITCANGARLTTKGFGSSVRGAHPGYIMVDDGLKDNVIYSKTQRTKSIEYFHAVIMNMIVPGGQVGVVGTPFHSNDLYGDLKTKKGWEVREYPAIFPDGTILWRERWGFKELLDKRETQGNLIFSRENLVKPVTNESTIFPIDVIEKSYIGMDNINFVNNKEAYKMKFDKVVTSIDFSISSNVGADYTVMLTAGIDDKDNIWLMNIQRFKGKKFSEQMAVMRSINTNFRPDVMVLEQNVFQQIFVQQGAEEGLPVVGHTTGTNKYDLKAGLPSVAILYETGKIKCPRGNDYDKDMSDLLASELSSVTWTDHGLEGVGEHDDLAMAMWLLTIAAKKVTSGFSFKFI
jgi:hypothetical protein